MKKIIQGYFTISMYWRGDHHGKVTKTICLNFGSPTLRSIYVTFISIGLMVSEKISLNISNSDLWDLFISEYNGFGFYSFKTINFSKWLTF